jgi:hypothetical protein
MIRMSMHGVERHRSSRARTLALAPLRAIAEMALLAWQLGGTPALAQARETLVEQPRGFLDRPSLERHRLRFELGGTVLGVPRNYVFDWMPTSMTQDLPGFIGMAAFPSFEGATRATIGCYDVLGVADIRGCDVVLFSASRPADPLTAPGRPPWYSFDPDRLPEPAEHGLLRNPKLPYVFIWIGPDSHRTGSISCHPALHSCEMALTASGIAWRVKFPHRLLPHWRAIRDGLTDLIASFARAAENRGASP